jgi:signal transduction histidine kinase
VSDRAAARLAWGSFALFMVVAATWLVLLALGDRGVSIVDAVDISAFVVVAAVGAVVASHRPRNPLGWIYLGLANWMILVAGTLDAYASYATTDGRTLPGATTAVWITNWAWVPPVGVLVTFVFLLFPDGHLPSPRWRHVAWLAAASMFAMSISFMFGSAEYTDPANRPVPNPYTTPSLAGFFDGAKPVCALVVIATAALCVASLFVRYRRGSRDERQQLKWLMSAGVLLVLYLSLPLDHGSGGIVDLVFGLTIAFVPISCGIAILKYRLYDIDVVINRAVVFGALAAFITLVYVGIVVGIGSLFGAADHANAGLQIAATAVVALAFQPVRRVVQRFANRIVYGNRATPYEVMADFSHRMAGTLEVDQALPQMAEAAARGVGAVAGRVRLFLPGGGERVVTWPPDAATSVPTRSIDVRYQGDPIGEIAVTKAPGDPLLPAEDELLRDLGAQAGLAMHNVRLTDELEVRLEELARQADQLRVSRQRLVTARDAQRRGLERDIREGPRRQLTEIADGVERAAARAASEPADVAELLDRLGERANDTLDGLRDLARGIFPPLLADKGIVAALDAHIRKVGVRATVETTPGFGDRRFDDQAEAAVYFCCLQALQNVLRHAGDTDATVRLSAGPEVLTFEVADHGAGFVPGTTDRGMGLQIMQDRVDALDGSLEVTSAPGAGTTVTGRIRARALAATS